MNKKTKRLGWTLTVVIGVATAFTATAGCKNYGDRAQYSGVVAGAEGTCTLLIDHVTGVLGDRPNPDGWRREDAISRCEKTAPVQAHVDCVMLSKSEEELRTCPGPRG